MKLPDGYALAGAPADAPVLAGPDGSTVAAFGPGLDPREVERAARGLGNPQARHGTKTGRYWLLAGGMPIDEYEGREEAEEEARKTNDALARFMPGVGWRTSVLEVGR